MAAAWGSAPVSAAGGGSIPLVNALQAAAPEAEILLVGATDGYANIHAPDERVILDELEKSVVAEAEFFARFAARWDAAEMQKLLDGIERARQQDARPGDPVPVALPRGDPALAGALLARRQGDLRGREAAAAGRGAALRRRLDPARHRRRRTEPEPADDYELKTETTEVQGLLSVDGVRFLFTSFVDNFRNFAAVAIILVVMIGVGLAEAAGLIGALIRKLVAVSSSSTLTFIIVLLGMISSVASDAGYLVLIPLGAVAFKSVGRNPLAGIAAAFAGVAAGFGVNFLITPLDGVLTEITNDASALVDPNAEIDLVANLYFGIASALFVTVVLTFVTRAARRGPHRRLRPRGRRRAAGGARRGRPRRRGARACATRCGRRSRCCSSSRCSR